MRVFTIVGVVLAMAGVAHADVRIASVTTAVVRDASATVVSRAVIGDYTLENAAGAVEDYFNGLTTLKADFTQNVTGEAFTSEGTFYLKKPRQFVWQYETPNRQKIVSTGTHAYYVDQEGGQQVTEIPMNAGLGRLFNAGHLNLAKEGLRVTGVTSNPRELIVAMAVTKKIAKDDQAGLKTVKIGFDRLGDGELRIKFVEALDTLQAVTKVEFSNVAQGVPLMAKLFEFMPGVYQNRN